MVLQPNDVKDTIYMLHVMIFIFFSPQQVVQSEESWDDDIVETASVEYHKMCLSPSAICVVDSPSKFESFLDSGFHVI